MILVADIGNTNIALALYDDGRIVRTLRLPTDVTVDELTLEMVGFLRESKAECAVLASVVPARTPILLRILSDFSESVKEVTNDVMAHYLGVKVDNPEEVGIDRLVNALAVHERGLSPAIVLDFGTATTFDVVDGDGNYLGGMIAPGPNVSARALELAAAKLPLVKLDHKPPKIIGTNTVGAMESGLYYGYLGLVKESIARIRVARPELMFNVVATGGLANLFVHELPDIIHAIPELTLDGLYRIGRDG